MRNDINRRDLLAAGAFGAAAAWCSGPVIANRTKNAKVLFFTKSSGFEHDQVRRKNGALGHAERVLIELGKQHGLDVEASKDGRIFDSDIDRFDAFVFYTTGDLTKPGTDKQPPMSHKGKAALLDAIQSGKGFAGTHSASDTFHSPGPRNQNQDLKQRDPYIAMLGGEFVTHGRQQKTRMEVVDARFPGMGKAGDRFSMHEEWYALKNFAPDLHVLLVNQTKGMTGKMYHRPPYPATWARRHGQGRVFFTSMGHRGDVWTNPTFQSIFAGGIRWACGLVDADVTPNIEEVCPHADQLG